MTLRLKTLALVVVALTVGVVAQTQRTNDPIITIDGAKNPELVPEWAAWRGVFSFMAAPAAPEVPIPTTICLVTTPEQQAFIRKEALRVIKEESDMGEVAVKLRDGLTADNLAQRTEEVETLEMRRRRVVLAGRDRLLGADLPVAAHTALREFAADVRRGHKAHVQKSQLAQYSLPE